LNTSKVAEIHFSGKNHWWTWHLYW